jgi:short-subunit dehydrogenase
MGSIAGLIATPSYSVYAATKYGLRGFTEALRREVGIRGIEVTGIYPGGVATEFGQKAGIKRKTRVSTPNFLKLTAEDVANTVLRVVKKPRRAVIIPGLMRPLVWLSVIFPGLVDQIIERRFSKLER